MKLPALHASSMYVPIFSLLLCVPSFSYAQISPEPSVILNQVRQQEQFKRLTPERQKQVEDSILNPPKGGDAATYHSIGSGPCDAVLPKGSVTLDVTVDKVIYDHSDKVSWSGTVTNNASLPLSDGSVLLRVTDASGTLMSETTVGDGLTIPKGATRDIATSWSIPSAFPSGSYGAEFRFLSGTYELTSTRVPLTVSGTVPAIPSFDRMATKVGGQPSVGMNARPVFFGKDFDIPIETVVNNPSSDPVTVEVVWSLSDASGKILDTRTETQTLDPNAGKSLRYVADHSKSVGTVTRLRIESKDGDASAFSDFDLVRDGFDDARIRFAGLDSTGGAIACVDTADRLLLPDTTLSFTLSDDAGRTLATSTLRGAVIPTPSLAKGTLSSSNASSRVFVLTTTLTAQDGKVLGSRTARYDCADVDPSRCPAGGPFSTGGKRGSWWVLAALILFVVVLLAMALIVFFRSRRRSGIHTPLLFLPIFFLGLVAMPRGAWGYTCTGPAGGGWGCTSCASDASDNLGDCSWTSYGCAWADICDVGWCYWWYGTTTTTCSCPNGQVGSITTVRDDTDPANVTKTNTCTDALSNGSCGTMASCGSKNIVISASATNINLRALYDLTYPAAPASGETVRFTVNGGVVVGSTSPSTPAMNVGSWPAGVFLVLVNNGTIIGAGGAGGTGGAGYNDPGTGYAGQDGGTAIYTRQSMTVKNNGTIKGGGGGGGGGEGMTRTANSYGGGGGGGAGSIAGTGGLYGNHGTDYMGNPQPAKNGKSGTLTTGGAGGARGDVTGYGSYWYTPGFGGSGGNLGMPGQRGGSLLLNGGSYGSVCTDASSNPNSLSCAGGKAGLDIDGAAYVVMNGNDCSTPAYQATPLGTCSSGAASATSSTSPWAWTCSGISGGTSATCPLLPPQTLRFCVNGVERSTVPIMYPNDVISLKTYFDAGSGCSGTDVTAQTTFLGTNAPGDAVTVTGANPAGSVPGDATRTATGNYPVAGASAAGQQNNTERITAAYPGQPTKTLDVTVYEVCDLDCSDSGTVCSGEQYSKRDSCGDNRVDGCTGTRDCDTNWKEVAPGF